MKKQQMEMHYKAERETRRARKLQEENTQLLSRLKKFEKMLTSKELQIQKLETQLDSRSLKRSRTKTPSRGRKSNRASRSRSWRHSSIADR